MMKRSVLILAAALALGATFHSELAAASPTELRGSIRQLRSLAPGKRALVSIKTPEGIYAVWLTRVAPRKPVARSENNLSQIASRSPLLFRGEIFPRNMQSLPSKLLGVAADIYNGKLNLRFYGKRTLRLYTAKFPLKNDSVIHGRLSHLPSQFPLNCAVSGGQDSPTVGSLALIRAARSRRVLDFAADADYEFQAAAGGSEAAGVEISQAMNVVNAIYSDQLGVEVNLVTQNVFTDEISQPYQTSEAEDLRDSVAAYRNSTPFEVVADASQLFTGKDMYVGSPGSGSGVVGISYLSIYPDYSDPGTVCRFDGLYSYTVVERYDSDVTYLGVLTAHELGHNLSLFHAESGVMNPAPNPSDTGFSSDSIETALNYIDQQGSCLTSIGPAVTMDSLRIRGGKFQAHFTPSNYAGEECKLRLFASGNHHDLLSDDRRHSRAKLLRSKKVTSDSAISFKGSVGEGRSRRKIAYYAIGEMYCNGEVSATSEVRSVRSNVNSFISVLKRALNKR